MCTRFDTNSINIIIRFGSVFCERAREKERRESARQLAQLDDSNNSRSNNDCLAHLNCVRKPFQFSVSFCRCKNCLIYFPRYVLFVFAVAPFLTQANFQNKFHLISVYGCCVTSPTPVFGLFGSPLCFALKLDAFIWACVLFLSHRQWKYHQQHDHCGRPCKQLRQRWTKVRTKFSNMNNVSM